MSSTVRSDFDQVFDEGGPQHLMHILQARLGHTEFLDRELHQMSRSGKWLVVWNKESGDGKIVGRIARTAPDDPS